MFTHQRSVCVVILAYLLCWNAHTHAARLATTFITSIDGNPIGLSMPAQPLVDDIYYGDFNDLFLQYGDGEIAYSGGISFAGTISLDMPDSGFPFSW